MPSLRIGIIGCGFGSLVQVPAFRRDPRVEVVALAGSRLETAAAAAARAGVPCSFGSWRELIASPLVDAVVIATPPNVQYHAALAAFAAGKPVLAEKPLASTLAEARELHSAAERAGIPAMIDFNFTELPAFLAAREILSANGIGRLRHAAVQWNVESRVNAGKFEHWKASRSEGGGTLFNFVSHSLYYLEWFWRPISQLSAKLSIMPGDERSGDTFVAMSIDFADGAAGSISMSASAYLGLGHRIEFYGDEGSLVLENTSLDTMRGFRLRHAARPHGYRNVALPNDDDEGDSRVGPTEALDRRFIDWIISGTPARPNFADAFRVQMLLEAALTSDLEGRRIGTLAEREAAQ